MGSGSFDDSKYRSSIRGRSAFAYSDDVMSKPVDEQKCHQLLDPFGLIIRESRDTEEHPESNAIMVGLDVTGSMGRVVVAIQNDLGDLMDILLKEKYVSDPQLLFYAVGDATCDSIPFQVSQFESDNRINDQLTKVVLEGGGGGQKTESYELGIYCAARHTEIDCFEKRGQKGYLISIGDEMPYPKVKRKEVKKIFDASLEEDIAFQTIIKEAQKKYHTFHILPKGSNHYNDPEVRGAWTRALGGEQFVFMLEDPTAAAATIALAIGLNEGRITLEEGLATLANRYDQKKVKAVSLALEEFAKSLDRFEGKTTPPKNDGKSGAKTNSINKRKKTGRF